MILAGGVAQVVKHLLSKHEALRSNPKKKRRRRRRKKKRYLCPSPLNLVRPMIPYNDYG
jgi:hypothetical protein